MALRAEIFLQGFLARVVPWEHEVLLAAYAVLEKPGFMMLALIGSLGALLAYALLYFLGTKLVYVAQHVSSEQQRARSDRARGLALRVLPFVMLCAGIHPIGTLAILAAGYYAMPLRIAAFAFLGAELVARVVMVG